MAVVGLVFARSALAAYGGGGMQGGIAVGVFALVLFLVGGCTGNDELPETEGEVRFTAAGDPAPQPLGDAVPLDGESASLRHGEVSVEVPSGAVASEATLTFGQSVGMVGEEYFGRPVSVEVTERLVEPLELRWDIAEVSEQQRASIVPLRWDEDLEVWAVDESDATDLSVDGDELVLVTSEFSWRSWSWAADFGQLVGERTGSRRSGPSCDGELPAWVTNVVDPGAGTSAAAIQVCFEPDGDDTITVRVVNNRPFTQRLEMTEGNQQWAWTWPGEESYDVSAAVTVAARQVFDSDTAFLLPPLSETAVGINRPQGGGSHFISATAIADHNTFLVDGIDYLLGLVTPGGFEDQLLNELVSLVYECGGSAALSGTDFTRVSTAIVDVMASCVSEVMTSNSDYGARFDAARIDAMAAASPERQAQLVKMNRSLHQLARAAHLLKAGELAFYFTDQLQNAYVGNLTLSISATGRAGELGQWIADCDDLAADSNRLFRNLTLRDPFYDTSRELWEFDELEPAAEQAVQPLEDCANEYLAQLAALLPDDWADGRAANTVADRVRDLLPQESAMAIRDLVYVREVDTDSNTIRAEPTRVYEYPDVPEDWLAQNPEYWHDLGCDDDAGGWDYFDGTQSLDDCWPTGPCCVTIAEAPVELRLAADARIRILTPGDQSEETCLTGGGLPCRSVAVHELRDYVRNPQFGALFEIRIDANGAIVRMDPEYTP